jgi:tetraacyldisaccharide 4'-kinase
MTLSSSARPWLAPLVPLHRLGLALRGLRLSTGLEAVRRLRGPVISIGNLSTGGAGKTPLTIALAQALTRRGLQVDVLSRGYGRSSRVAARVDPAGTADEFGDEPLLIAREAAVPVYVAPKRYQAGLLAERDLERPMGVKGTGFSPYMETAESDGASALEGNIDANISGIHLLDDGFQHRQLHRDIDILLVDRRDWQDRLLPAGNLREPLAAVRRATCLAVPADDREFEAELRVWGWQGPIWHLHRRMDVPRIDGPVVAFCGIARPEQFFNGLESDGLYPAARVAFADHHRYTPADLDRLRDTAHRLGAAAFITTEKDRVRLGKLGARLAELCPLETAALRIRIEDEEASLDWILGRLPGARS